MTTAGLAQCHDCTVYALLPRDIQARKIFIYITSALMGARCGQRSMNRHKLPSVRDELMAAWDYHSPENLRTAAYLWFVGEAFKVYRQRSMHLPYFKGALGVF